MADQFTPEKRRAIMSAIRSKNTKAELIVFNYLNKNKIYYQKHYKNAPGTPDISKPRKKLAVFIDGEFWHGKNLQKDIEHGLKSYWRTKILNNIERDRRQELELELNGWKILRIWEKDIIRKKTQNESLLSIKEHLNS